MNERETGRSVLRRDLLPLDIDGSRGAALQVFHTMVYGWQKGMVSEYYSPGCYPPARRTNSRLERHELGLRRLPMPVSAVPHRSGQYREMLHPTNDAKRSSRQAVLRGRCGKCNIAELCLLLTHATEDVQRAGKPESEQHRQRTRLRHFGIAQAVVIIVDAPLAAGEKDKRAIRLFEYRPSHSAGEQIARKTRVGRRNGVLPGFWKVRIDRK
jgi:hypothetical protein